MMMTDDHALANMQNAIANLSLLPDELGETATRSLWYRQCINLLEHHPSLTLADIEQELRKQDVRIHLIAVSMTGLFAPGQDVICRHLKSQHDSDKHSPKFYLRVEPIDRTSMHILTAVATAMMTENLEKLRNQTGFLFPKVNDP